MNFTAFTNQGSKERNTDDVLKYATDSVGAFAVIDGGDFCGDIVAEFIKNAVCEELKKDLRVDSAVLRNCFRKAFEVMKEKTETESGFKNAKASCAIFITDGSKLIYGHMGNCRIYELSRDKIKTVTADHTNESDGKLLVSINSEEFVDADLSDIKRMFNKKFLICTDGFWKNISKEEIEEASSKTENNKAWLFSMLNKIEANADTGCDCVSAIIIGK